jgi:hypothetical protein
MLIVRLLTRGSAHEHMMPVGECLRTRYAPASSNTEELEHLLASSLFGVAESLSLSEVQMSMEKIKHLTAFGREAGSSDRVLEKFDDNTCE